MKLKDININARFTEPPLSEELLSLQKMTVSWRPKQPAQIGWKRRFLRAFSDTVFWRVFLGT